MNPTQTVIKNYNHKTHKQDYWENVIFIAELLFITQWSHIMQEINDS